jgi:LysM repeat protein
VLLALVTIPLVIAAALFALNGGAATASQDELVAGVTYEYVTVEPGGSLWAIAQEVAPASDPRDVIADILSFNGMSSAELFPGQQLALPPKYETGE